MNFYDTYILPRLINLAMQNKAARAERARFVPLALWEERASVPRCRH